VLQPTALLLVSPHVEVSNRNPFFECYYCSTPYSFTYGLTHSEELCNKGQTNSRILVFSTYGLGMFLVLCPTETVPNST